jgi:hypothetical protein
VDFFAIFQKKRKNPQLRGRLLLKQLAVCGVKNRLKAIFEDYNVRSSADCQGRDLIYRKRLSQNFSFGKATLKFAVLQG